MTITSDYMVKSQGLKLNTEEKVWKSHSNNLQMKQLLLLLFPFKADQNLCNLLTGNESFCGSF